MPHRSNAVIMLRRKPCHTVLLRIHLHAAELDDPKFLLVHRATNLLVKYRSVVVQLNQDGRDQEKGRRQNEENQGTDDIHRPLAEALSKGQRIFLRQIDRSIKQMKLCGALYKDIRNLRHHILPHSVGIAELHQVIALESRNIPEDNRHFSGFQNCSFDGRNSF